MSERYKKEIEEILRQAGDLAPSGQRKASQRSLWRLVWRYIAQSLGGKAWSISPGRVMLVAICLLLLALAFGMTLPGIGGPLALAGLLLFIVGYALFFVRPPKFEKRWRGQPLDDRKGSWWERLRRRLK